MADPGKAFALPAFLYREYERTIRRKLGKRPRTQIILVGTCPVEAVILPAALRPWLSKHLPFIGGKEGICYEGRLGDRIVPVWSKASSARVEMTQMDRSEIPWIKEDSELDRRAAAKHYVEDLKHLSRVTGFAFVLHCDAPVPCEPYPSEPVDTLHLVLGSVPVGDSDTEYRAKAFGYSIESKNWNVYRRLPTRGRGYVAKDGDAPMVQLLDTTCYVLIPLLSFYHGEESHLIFRALLACAWNLFQDVRKKKVPALEEQEGSGAFIAKLKEAVGGFPDVWIQAAKTSEDEIEELRTKLAYAYRRRNEMLAMAKVSNQEPFLVSTMDRLPKDEQAVRSHPLVQRLYVCDGGLHVETKTVVVEHEGARFPVGRFVIRFNQVAKVKLWCIETRHPNGIPHPHMPKHGTPCFGTATEAIAQAAGEYRFADAVQLILRWLEDSYVHETAEAKITEWPREVAHG